MSETFTVSATEVYTETDVKTVMRNTYEDIIGFANRKLVEYTDVKKWIEDIIYILNKKVLKAFEIQLINSSNEKFKSYRYEVNENGFITSGTGSGGINYFDFPDNTKVKLFVELHEDRHNTTEVRRALIEERGWGTNGVAMSGNSTYERTHASGALALKRYVITK
jgi:hypothetical protein